MTTSPSDDADPRDHDVERSNGDDAPEAPGTGDASSYDPEDDPDADPDMQRSGGGA